MKKRILSILLAVSLLVSHAATAFASSPVCGLYRNNTLLNEYDDLQEAVAAVSAFDDVDYEGVEYTVKLYSDVELTEWTYISSEGFFANIAIALALDGPELDLNGHTLTIAGDIDESVDGVWAIASSRADSIKNGSIVFNFGDKSSLTYGSCGVFYMLPTEPVSIDGLALIATNDNRLSYGVGTLSYYKTTIELKNSVIDVGGTAITFQLSEDMADTNTTIEIASGSYKNLDVSDTYEDRFTISGTKLSQLPNDVANGTTVITSDDTTAIIVKDGAAYTYDTLQDAVDAADGKTEILLVKQPEEGTVTIPDGKTPIFAPLDGDEEIKMDDIPLVDEDGQKLEITEDGTLKPAVVSVTGVTLSRTEMSLTVGDTATLTATVAPANATNKTVTWASSDEAVATVENGKVTAVAVGTATITVTTVDGSKTAACTITVSPVKIPATGITLDEDALTLYVDEEAKLTATVTPADSTDTVTWSSDNEAVATVENGTVTAHRRGEATITAKAGEFTASCQVEVIRRPSSSGGDHDDPDYAVTVDKDMENGTVTVSPKRAEKGDTVTITVKPDKGYELDELIVTDSKGNELDLREKGDNKFTFKMPGSKVTVEATFRAVEEIPEKPEVVNPFVDVNENAYYHDAVLWAVEKGITGGTSAATFSPDEACTRAQMVTFLWRAAGSPVVNYAMSFTDVPADAYYAEAVRWAVSQGITAGTSATTFDPNATVTRGQTVTFLWRAAGSPVVAGDSFADVAADAYYAPAVAWAVREGITAGIGAETFAPSADCTRGQIVTFLYRDMTK